MRLLDRPLFVGCVLGVVILRLLLLPQASQAQPPSQPQPVPGAAAAANEVETVTFDSGEWTLRGLLFRPAGPGPFPAVLYNHGSAPGMLNNQAFYALAPLFTKRGWIFFAPYRRGTGLSVQAGAYLGDEIGFARRRILYPGGALLALMLVVMWFGVLRRQRTGIRVGIVVAVALSVAWGLHVWSQRAAASTMVRLLDTEQFADQRAAFEWLQRQPFVQRDRVAAAGNSFGGVLALLGAERLRYCAVVDAAGGAESWAYAPGLRTLMDGAARHARAPVMFIQAENDYDLSPSRSLAQAMRDAGKDAAIKIYPSFGRSPADGHSFPWRGGDIWADDVLGFLNPHCSGRTGGEDPS